MPVATGNMTKYRRDIHIHIPVRKSWEMRWHIGVCAVAWPKGRMSVKKCSLRMDPSCTGLCVWYTMFWHFPIPASLFSQCTRGCWGVTLSKWWWMRCWKPLEIPEHWHILCNTPQRIQRGAKDIASCILNSFEVFQHANHFSINCQEVFLEIDQLKGLARPVTSNQ